MTNSPMREASRRYAKNCPCILCDCGNAFEAGYRAAIEAAAKVVQEHGEGGNIHHHGLLMDKLEALAEEKEPGE